MKAALQENLTHAFEYSFGRVWVYSMLVIALGKTHPAGKALIKQILCYCLTLKITISFICVAINHYSVAKEKIYKES